MLEEAGWRRQAATAPPFAARVPTFVLFLVAFVGCAHDPGGWHEVAPGVHVFTGALAEPTPGNRGEIATLSFVAGTHGTLVIDTGTSVLQASRLEREARVRGLPAVSAAVNTAAHGERIFGNGRYADRPLYAHPEAARLMRERCAVCLEQLRRELGAQVMAGTDLVVPTRSVQAGDRLHAGERELEVLDYGWSASPGAIALWDAHTRTLFAGDLAAFGRIPQVRDARLDGWLAAIDALIALEPRIIVPGWGPPGDVATLLAMRGYLTALEARVEALLDAGVGLLDATSEAELPAYRDWPLYATVHRRNVHDLYVALERERFERSPAGVRPRP